MGIHDHCTPGLASEIAMTAAAMDSFEEAQANLSQQGIFLNVKTIQTIVYKYAQRARLMQKAGTVVYDVSLRGRRVVISTDGGRVRIRKNKRGKKTNKGRNRKRKQCTIGFLIMQVKVVCGVSGEHHHIYCH
ncbi:MAG: hypothetical protein HF982_14805 [Desulfobacteraceae bacterium]|nr:hypothetical protein [Desulfobacteraceae bacterium]MBC2720825.1 hypothetical protein [Desulfobacteraceae bacterium]